MLSCKYRGYIVTTATVTTRYFYGIELRINDIFGRFTDQSGHGHGQPERTDRAEMHDVIVQRRAALHHVVQGRQGDGGPGSAGRSAARVSQPIRLRRISVSGAQGRRRDGTERRHSTPGR